MNKRATAAPAQTFTLDASPAPVADPNLDSLLAGFNSPPLQGEVTGSTSIPGQINGLPDAEVVDSEELTPVEEENEGTEEAEEETGEEETEELEPTAFNKEFEKQFGLPVDQARETINELLAFKDEMTLVRAWDVSFSEYNQRLAQVREFYQTLPEDKQPEFNTIEGAKAIWEHLSKNQPQSKRQPTVSKSGGSKNKTAKSTQKPFINKSDILRMPPEEYNRKLPEISRAWREGRVREDV